MTIFKDTAMRYNKDVGDGIFPYLYLPDSNN